MRHISMIMMAAALLLTACGSNSRRAEIDARRAALIHKQDSTLAASQARLAVVDSTLQAVNREYEAMKATVEQHRAELRATEQELTALTRLRMHRDSLQTEWEVLGAKIKYIRKVKVEK
ncbi:MAG: hypothetical protein IJ841_04470 [Prevotella sp.]|nr:hypothetical protein [Prevotella sp.]